MRRTTTTREGGRRQPRKAPKRNPEGGGPKIFLFVVRPFGDMDNSRAEIKILTDTTEEGAIAQLEKIYSGTLVNWALTTTWEGDFLEAKLAELVGSPENLSLWQTAAALRYAVVEHGHVFTEKEAKDLIRLARKLDREALVSILL